MKTIGAIIAAALTLVYVLCSFLWPIAIVVIAFKLLF